MSVALRKLFSLLVLAVLGVTGCGAPTLTVPLPTATAPVVPTSPPPDLPTAVPSAAQLTTVPSAEPRDSSATEIAPATETLSDGATWESEAQMQVARGEVAAAELDGRIYVVGGFGGLNVVEEFEPGRDPAWGMLAPLPDGRHHPAAASANGKLYVLGGYNANGAPQGTLFEYDPATAEWQTRAAMPTPRGALTAVTLDDKIYAIGGVASIGDVGTVEVYDPATDTWQTRKPMLTPRDHLAAGVVNGKIYVVGGRLGSYANNLNVNEEYDPVTDSWSIRAELPTARSGVAGAVVNDLFFVFGGESPLGTYSQAEAYDPANDRWLTFPEMPVARHGLGAAVLENRIYVLAGGRTPGGSESDLNQVLIVP